MPPADPPLVLVVDGNGTRRRKAAGIVQQCLGWRTEEAATGQEALARLAQTPSQTVLTDLTLPDMDGIEFVDAVREAHPEVPIVLMTSAVNEKAALKALQRGAATYVPKGQLALELADSLERVVAASRTAQTRRRLLSCMKCVEFEFVLDNDAALIPALVAQVQEQATLLKLCDQNGVIRIGVALEEAILNGMYHGNLEVSSQLRQEDESHFHRLIEERRAALPFTNRRLTVRAHLSSERAEFVVADQGPGFDPSTLPDPTDPANLEQVGGRGLLLIRTFMDEVSFNTAGNRITLIKYRDKKAGGVG